MKEHDVASLDGGLPILDLVVVAHDDVPQHDAIDAALLGVLQHVGVVGACAVRRAEHPWPVAELLLESILRLADLPLNIGLGIVERTVHHGVVLHGAAVRRRSLEVLGLVAHGVLGEECRDGNLIAVDDLAHGG